MIVSYRMDHFLHFEHLEGCATHARDGLPCGYFGATFAQIYGKLKVPFYNHSPHQDRNGKSIEPGEDQGRTPQRVQGKTIMYVCL